MRVTQDHSRDAIPRSIPKRAIVLSGAALAVPVVAGVFLTQIGAPEQGLLVWVAVLVPAFLLAYYRGLKGAAVALAGGMAALSVTQVVLLVFGVAAPNWGLLLIIVSNLLVIALGIGIFAELLHRERRKVEALALVDPLTKLPNRRHAEVHLGREFAAAMRGRQLGVVMYDIDHFKQFNDTHGHAAGDDVLRAFAVVLEQHTRRQNLSARYGGEEFISVVSDVGLDGLKIFAGRVRESIKAANLKWGTVTVSVGVAMHREGMGSHEVLVAAADRALYAAKAAGRDRIEIASDLAAPRVRPPPAPTALLRRRRVLVVDDDPDVRETLVRALEGHGYDARDTGSPHHAAELLRGGSESFDVLVTSVVMPRISGFRLVDQLTPTAPDLRVVYMSDSMRERVSWSGVPGVIHKFVPKPVDPQVLVESVKEAIEAEVEISGEPWSPDRLGSQA